MAGKRRRRLILGGAATVAIVVLLALLIEPVRTGDVLDPPRLALACLAGEDHHRPNPDVCSTVLGTLADGRSEPWIAIHPGDPQTFAVGMNARSAPVDPAPDPDPRANETAVDTLLRPVNRTLFPADEEEPAPAPPPCPSFGLCLHITHDAGATWTVASFPKVDNNDFAADASMVYSPDGALHVVGLRMGGAGIVHAATRDDGRSWSPPTYVTQTKDKADRPWISMDAAGRLAVTWQTNTDPPRTHVSLSDDEGQSWQRAVGIDSECNLQGPAVATQDGAWVFACIGRPIANVLVYAIDADGEARRISRISDMAWGIQAISAATDGRLVLVTAGRPSTIGGSTIYARTSDDGGESWGRAVDLLGVTGLDDRWDWFWLSWAQVDAGGVLHALVVGARGENCYHQECGEARLKRQVFWIAVHPETGDRWGQELLTPKDPDARAWDRPAPVRPPRDDYHHIMPYGEGALLAWGHDGLVEMTRVVPAR